GSAGVRACPTTPSRPDLTDAVTSRSGSQGRDELLDSLVARFERVLAEPRALRLVVQLQMHPVDRVVALALLGAADELAAQPRPRRLRRLVDGPLDRLVGAHPLDHVAGLQPVEQAARPVHVMVLKVALVDLRRGERELMLLAVRLDQVVLYDPVALAVELERVALERGQAVLPHLERLLLQGREALRLRVTQGTAEVLALDLERAQLTAVGQPDPPGAGHVVAELPDGPDRVLERHVPQHDRRVLEHPQQDRRRTDLQKARVLAHVRV